MLCINTPSRPEKPFRISKGDLEMKKNLLLILFLLFVTACSSGSTSTGAGTTTSKSQTGDPLPISQPPVYPAPVPIANPPDPNDHSWCAADKLPTPTGGNWRWENGQCLYAGPPVDQSKFCNAASLPTPTGYDWKWVNGQCLSVKK